MIATFPMKLQSETVRFGLDDHLFEDRTMRWNRATVQPFLDVRTAVLNDTLEDAFFHRCPGFRSTSDDQVLPKAA